MPESPLRRLRLIPRGLNVRRSVLELFYGPLAPAYPLLTHLLFGDAWRAWQRAALPWLAGVRVVAELGSGPGDLAADLAGKGKRVLAIDRSRTMTRLARRRIARFERVWIVCADARRLPLRDACLDAVVTTFPTEVFLTHELTSEVARVLRPGGLYVAVVAAQPRSWPWWMRLFRRFFGPAAAHVPLDCARLPSPPPVPLFAEMRWETRDDATGRVCLWIARRAS
ncbi:class I SAM-dependent methyltransferase [Thermomicrobium sp.]